MSDDLPLASITLNISEAYAVRESLYIMSVQARDQEKDDVWGILISISMRFNQMFTPAEWSEYYRLMNERTTQENNTEGTE